MKNFLSRVSLRFVLPLVVLGAACPTTSCDGPPQIETERLESTTPEVVYKPFTDGAEFGWKAYLGDYPVHIAEVRGKYADVINCVGYVVLIHVDKAHRGGGIGTRLARLMTGEFIRRRVGIINVVATSGENLWLTQGYKVRKDQLLVYETGIDCPHPDPDANRSNSCS